MTLLFYVLLAAGCNGNVKVTGKVTFPDGTPLTTGQVVFENEKLSAMGKLSDDGTYTLGTDKEKNGIPQGEYRVAITGAVTYASTPQPLPSANPSGAYNPGATSPPLPSSISLIHRKFRSTETSGLSCSVTKNTTFDFTVEKP